MKTLPELREEQLQERYLKKGVGLMYAARSKSHGDKAERHFARANQYLQQPKKPTDTLEDRVETIVDALSALTEGLIELRNQNGANTALGLTSVLLSERKLKR